MLLLELIRLLRVLQVFAWLPAIFLLAVSLPFDQVIKLGPLVLDVENVFYVVFFLAVYLQ